MEMALSPIVGTLAYILNEETDEVLLIRRDSRPNDDHFGKVNGLGGKVETNEHILSGLRRELLEEANITIRSMELRGIITWTDFGPKREDWLGFIFLVRDWDGDPKAFNDEGSLEWVPKQNLLNACSSDSSIRKEMNLPLWEGDRHFVPLVFDNDPRTFYGLMPYDGESFESWSYERL